MMDFLNKYLHKRLPGLAFWSALAVLGAIGVGLLVYATPYGPGLINDSVIYLGGAENLLHGDGYSRTSGGGEIKPITVNPPFYPIVVAAVSLTGLSLIKSGWVISLACFFLNTLLVGALLRKLTRSDALAIFGAALFVGTDSFLRAHTFALTEPLFITLSLGTVLCLADYLENRKLWTLLLAALLVNLSYLTRYIGVANLAAGLAALAVFLPDWGKRLRAGLIFLGASLVGGVAWFTRNLLVAGNAANRSIGFHPLTPDKVREGVVTFWSWLLPDRFNLVERVAIFWNLLAYLFVVVFIVVTAVLWLRALRREKSGIRPTTQLAMTLAAWAVAYFAALLASLTFADASTALENRILAPAFVFLMLLFVYWLEKLLANPRKGLALTGLVMAGLVFLSIAYDGRREVIDLRQDGQGYSSSYFRNSPTIDMVRGLPQTILYSNRVPAINLLADRNAYALLAPIDPLTREKRPGYDQSLNYIRGRVLKGEAVLVIFEAQSAFDDPIEGQWLRDVTKDVPLMAENSDGNIYGTIKP